MSIVRRTGLAALLTLCVLPILAAPANDADQPYRWKPAPAPLLTRWAKDVSPGNVRPEYPRPMAQRKEWMSLNGLWEFDFDDLNQGMREGWQEGPPLTRRILVPFTFESALSGIGKGAEVHERVWYRRTFKVPRSWRDRTILLNFNACDWETTVWVNGHHVGTHRGGYTGFSFDITEALVSGAREKEVVVAVYDPAHPDRGAYQPRGKQLGSGGVWHTRTTGIWQSVWLEPVPKDEPILSRIEATVDLATSNGLVTIAVDALTRDLHVEMDVMRDGRLVATEPSDGPSQPVERGLRYRSLVVCPVSRCELWSPEQPTLYDLRIRIYRGTRKIDELRSYCAFREYAVKDGRLTLNGKPYFLRGVLDQGYWPDGGMTPPTDDAIRNDVEVAKKLGFNMARKHVKVEDRRWYYWCDRLGLAVWQDMPASHNLSTDAGQSNFINEWASVMQATRRHPCVVHWIPFNENWGHPGSLQDDIVGVTRLLDPSRPITGASGGFPRASTDVIDVHDYSNNLRKLGVENPVKPKVVGEYGGIKLAVEGHIWTESWSHRSARDAEGLLRQIRFQTTQLFEARNLSGFVYAQLTDVEQDTSGLLTYDRLPKADVRRFSAIFEGRDRATASEEGFIRNWLALGPLPTGTDLESADNTPVNRFAMRQILANSLLSKESTLQPRAGEAVTVAGKLYHWRTVSATDNALDFHRLFGMETRNQAAYAVAQFDVAVEHKNVALVLGSDDGARVWLNSCEVWTTDEIRGVSADQDMVEGLTLKAGRNIIVVKVGQGVGGWGLTARFELRDGSILPLSQAKR